jgi:ketosteroid isomerase-like protein
VPGVDNHPAKATVLRFNDFINAGDIDGLARMMSEDHVFIDTANNKIVGKAACISAWRGFFAAFPDYRNDFEYLCLRGDFVVVVGRSASSDPRLQGPALWTAAVRGGLVVEWRVLADTPANRASLGLPSSA